MWIWHLLASKVPTAGGSTVPFRALSQNKSSVSLCVVLESVPLRREKYKPRPQNRALVPLEGSFQNFRRVTLFFHMGINLSLSFWSEQSKCSQAAVKFHYHSRKIRALCGALF